MLRRALSLETDTIEYDYQSKMLYNRLSDSKNSFISSFSSQGDHIDVDPINKISNSSIKPQKQRKNKQKENFNWGIYKKLLGYARKNIFMLIGSLLLTILCGIILSLIPWQIGKILDVVTQANQDPNVKTIFNTECIFLTLSILSLGLFTFGRSILTQQVQEKIAVQMRTDVFGTFIHNDLKFYEKYKSGDLISRLGSDIAQAKSAISNNLTFLMRNAANIIINFIVLFIMSWKLTLMILSTVPLFGIIVYYYSKYNKIYTKQYQDILAQMSAHASQNFKGITIVKAYCTENFEAQKYKKINIKGYKVMTKRNIWFSIFNTANQFLPYLATLIVLWFGGLSILSLQNQELTAGQLTAFILYCNNLVNNTSAISQSYSNIISGTHAIQKVFQMLQYVPDVDEKVGSNISINGEITFKNVEFKYPSSEVNILKDLSLKINKGEYVAFVGPSGSGKSTIIKIIQRLYKISSGSIYFDRHNAQEINVNLLRKQIGLVSQQPILFSGTIKENITYGLEQFTEDDVQAASKKSGCWQFLNNQALFPKGLQTQLGQNGVNLSGGQKQRIAIARALIRKPKILIFDEATSALDAHSEAIIQKSIQNIANSEKGMTIIVIAHRLSTIINANRIVMLKNGEIVQEGTHDDLRQKRGQYYELVQKQLQQKTKA